MYVQAKTGAPPYVFNDNIYSDNATEVFMYAITHIRAWK